MEKRQMIEKEKHRDYSLDIIKAIGIILVLCWHFQPFDITAPRLLDYHIRGIFREGIKAFYLQITLLGVPSFILVSMYLYFKRLDEHGLRYTKPRLWHLINIFVFWVSVQILVVYIADIPKSIPFIEQMKLLFGSLSLRGVFLEGGAAHGIRGWDFGFLLHHHALSPHHPCHTILDACNNSLGWNIHRLGDRHRLINVF